MSEPQLLNRPDGVLAVREPGLPPPHRLLVLLHGVGGNELSMWIFAEGLPADYRVIAPRGPVVKSPGEYSWRPTIMGRRSHLEENIQPARDLVARIDAWANEAGVDATRFSVMGFSQGAALVYVLAGLFPQRLLRAAVLSGYPPRGLDLSTKPLTDIPFLVTHGTQDDIIAIEEAQKALPMLEKAGARVTYIVEDLRHVVGDKARQAIRSFFK
ncbi:MAG: dienelactone hydrolase family protein [Anaerolineaceae bacterium]